MIQQVKNVYHLGKSIAANTVFGFPARKLRVIGVTGTDGKTTTVSLIYHILKENDVPVSMLSTVGAYIDGRQIDTGLHVTTPDALLLQKIIKSVVTAGSQYLILEVTSHGLDQNRVWGIPFEIGVITNVSEEHLDYHKTYKNYVSVKSKLLKHSKTAVVNADDRSFQLIYPKLKEMNKNIILYGKKRSSDVNAENVSFAAILPGDFNMYNVLAATAVCRTLGLSDEKIEKSLKSFTAPKGRQQLVYNKTFKVIIDFAHTPHSLEEILKVLRNQTQGRLIHVFGSAGHRDAYKRPKMGSVSSEFADIIILTAEDPRNESVDAINREIEKGISSSFTYTKDSAHMKTHSYTKIEDRQNAIECAVRIAHNGDTIVITGKGHEQSMNYGNGEEPWDEESAVKKALERRNTE